MVGKIIKITNETGIIEIHVKDETNVSIQIIDMFGRNVITRNNLNLTRGLNKIPLSMLDFRLKDLSGAYLLKVIDKQSTSVVKFLINN